MNAVTCLKWVKKGAAKARPDQIKLTEEEMTSLVQDMKKTALSEESESDEELPRKRTLKNLGGKTEGDSPGTSAAATKGKKDDDDDDESDDDDEDESNPLNLAGITFYDNQKDDPYLAKEPDSDDDLEILSSDNLVTIGKVNKDDCNLEVYIYNEQEGNCWCHHDYILPTIPLCLEWLDFDPGSENSGNFVAVGSMGSDIELWDLDVLESLEPAFVLAGQSVKSGKSSKKKKRKSITKGHTDAILDLAWNRNQKQALASASADFSLGLWDLEQGEMVTSFPHDEKVQTIMWHPTDAKSLLSGCADHTIKLFDCQNLEPDVIQWTVSGEVENVLWDNNNSDCFLASTDDGVVYYFDKRNSKEPLFEFKAHKESVTGMSLSSKIKGCFVTCSSDKSIKMWDVNNHENPKLIITKQINIGQLFCISECPDTNLIYAVGGERELKVLNLKKDATVVKHFGLCEKVGDHNGSDDVEIPIHGGLDGRDVYYDEDDENNDDGPSQAFKKKKTHRGKKHKKNISQNEEGTSGDKSLSIDNVAKSEMTDKDNTDITQTSGDSMQIKKKKKKKKKKKVVQESDN